MSIGDAHDLLPHEIEHRWYIARTSALYGTLIFRASRISRASKDQIRFMPFGRDNRSAVASLLNLPHHRHHVLIDGNERRLPILVRIGEGFRLHVSQREELNF